MKKWLIAVFALGLMVALAVETVEQLVIAPNTVSDWGDVVMQYYKGRQMPPIPSPIPYTEVASRMSADDWSFLSIPFWTLNHNGGTLYVSGEAAFDKKLKLPMKLLIYEDLMRGEVVILGAPLDSDNYKGMALFEAPEWMPYEEGFPLERYLMDELGPRRVIASYILKSEEDAWADMLSAQQAALAVPSLPMMMAMSGPPAEHTNDLWLAIDSTNLYVYAPEGFTNHVEVYTATDLIDGLWTVATQNLMPSGTNPATLAFPSTEACGFFRAGNMDIDTDGDLICDAREMFVTLTSTTTNDTDGDLISDYQEFYVDSTDPNNDDTSPPTVYLTKPLGTHVLIP